MLIWLLNRNSDRQVVSGQNDALKTVCSWKIFLFHSKKDLTPVLPLDINTSHLNHWIEARFVNPQFSAGKLHIKKLFLGTNYRMHTNVQITFLVFFSLFGLCNFGWTAYSKLRLCITAVFTSYFHGISEAVFLLYVSIRWPSGCMITERISSIGLSTWLSVPFTLWGW